MIRLLVGSPAYLWHLPLLSSGYSQGGAYLAFSLYFTGLPWRGPIWFGFGQVSLKVSTSCDGFDSLPTSFAGGLIGVIFLLSLFKSALTLWFYLDFGALLISPWSV